MKTVLCAATGVALLWMEVSTAAVAGHMDVSDHFTCSGKIAKLGTGDADRSIGWRRQHVLLPIQILDWPSDIGRLPAR
jgi:hypothetical protein